jgi:hypothetical protein
MQSPTPTFATPCHAVEAVLAGTSPLAIELVRAVVRAFV